MAVKRAVIWADDNGYTVIDVLRVPYTIAASGTGRE